MRAQRRSQQAPPLPSTKAVARIAQTPSRFGLGSRAAFSWACDGASRANTLTHSTVSDMDSNPTPIRMDQHKRHYEKSGRLRSLDATGSWGACHRPGSTSKPLFWLVQEKQIAGSRQIVVRASFMLTSVELPVRSGAQSPPLGFAPPRGSLRLRRALF